MLLVLVVIFVIFVMFVLSLCYLSFTMLLFICGSTSCEHIHIRIHSTFMTHLLPRLVLVISGSSNFFCISCASAWTNDYSHMYIHGEIHSMVHTQSTYRHQKLPI